MIGSGEKDSKVNAIIRAFRVLDRMNRGRPGARQSDTLYYQMMGHYYTRLRNARAEGNFVAAHTVFFPTEIIYSLGLVPMHTELTTWMMSLFLGDAADILSAGAGLGLAPEICTAHRGLAGAFALHALPRPDVMLWSNMLCDNTAKSGELVMEINGCPGFFLDHPYQRSQGEVDYLVDELKDLIAFLEKQSGRKMDWELLAATVARMDHQIELYRQISQLRRAIPTPFPPQGFLQMLASDYLFPGQPQAIEYLEATRRELADMVARGVGVVAKERFRLMTLFVPPMYLMGFLERISQEYGAVSVVEPFFTHWGEGRLDPSRPLESIARKSYML
ncbi:MAG: 2-hydroxyacyl-CoA dehydratase family protein, partial [Chloroflexota bacterium]